MSFDCVLMIGFGGPTPGCCKRREGCRCPEGKPSGDGEEARCFVSGILGDNPARQKRVDEIAEHYQHLGGFSPYNELTFKQAEALETSIDMPVRCAFRHWSPWPKDVLRELKAAGHERMALLIMSPHQCSVSWDWYIKFAGEAVAELSDEAPALDCVIDPWSAEDGFIEALAGRIHEVTVDWDAERIAKAALLFTAHAIPQPLEETSPYRKQFEETARLVAEKIGHVEHRVAFQSQPDTPGMPWSQPVALDLLDELKAAGHQDVIVQAAGFLVDHVEVLYDCDHELKERCADLGLNYCRAPCVHDHPAFITLLGERVLAKA